MAMISGNILRLKDNIAHICQKTNRKLEDIVIVGITKYSGLKDIQESLKCGLTHIGESKVQQAFEKYPHLANVTKHMVGHLQTNKVKTAVELFDVIQSVDSYRLAKAIDEQCVKQGRQMQILVQVNTAQEKQKFGCSSGDTFDLLKQVSELKNVRVIGLMTIAPLTEKHLVVRDCFKKLKDLHWQAQENFAQAQNVQMKFLSMGMSDDYAIALEEGANMLRIGRDIFLRK